jgi:hypothetical protein
MIRSTSWVIDPALFAVPSMFSTWIGRPSFLVLSPCLDMYRGLINIPVAPQSSSAFPLIFLCMSRVYNPISSMISFLMFRVLTKNLSVSSWMVIGHFRITIFLFW